MSQSNGRGLVVALDRERHLRYTINSLAELAQRTGVDLAKGQEGGIGFVALRGMLWAGLYHEDESLTIEQAGDLFQAYLDNGGKFAVLSALMLDGLRLAGFGTEPEKKSDAEEPAAPLASPSGSIASSQ